MIENNEIKNIAKNIQEAREFKGLSITELANELGITKQTVSSYEKGKIRPSEKILIKLSESLNVPIKALVTENSDNHKLSIVSYRKLKSTPQKKLNKSKLLSKFLGKIVVFIDLHIKLPAVKLPDVNPNAEPKTKEEIEKIAYDLRREWNLGLEPIKDFTFLLEKNGVCITVISIDDKIDAFSYWCNNRPIIVLSKSKVQSKAVRLRFDLAHELFHLISHRHINPDLFLTDETLYDRLETEAHFFASCFLLPRESFLKDLISHHYYALVMVKKKWGVSIQAMISRLAGMSLINKNQQVYLYMQIKDRKNEIYDDQIKPEEPKLLTCAFKTLLNNTKTKEFIEDSLNMNIDRIIELSSINPDIFINKNESTSFDLTIQPSLQESNIRR